MKRKRMKWVVVVLLMMAILMGGCGNSGVSQEEQKQSNESTSEVPEREIEKELRNLYGSEDTFTETLGDIEFDIPEKFVEDTKKSRKWKYYYYDDLMLGTCCEKENGFTNESFSENSDSYINGVVEDDDGEVLNVDIIELPIGKAIKYSIEQTVNEKRYILHSIAFVYNSQIYNIGFMEEKDSQWDYSEDFNSLINSITKKGIAGFSGKELQNFSSDFQGFKNWFEENANECIYSERSKDGNVETYNISTGVVSDSSSVIKWIDFIQRTEEGAYSKQSADTKGIILENSNKFSDFQGGDGIKIYYYINPDNETEILAMEKIEPEFTIEDYVNSYKEQCKEYTYEEIARNPENVKGEYAKLIGEVIQVLESGNIVTLRVDITKDKYGYYSDTVYVTYTRKSDGEDRILEDDIITIYGKLAGMETYTAVLGQEVSLPKINAEYIEIQ